MIYEFVFPSRELEFSRNEDGTHRLRAVQAGGPPMEFTCDLKPHLTVRVSLDYSSSLVRNDGVVCIKVTELDLHVQGRIHPDENHQDWFLRVLDRDDCGGER